MSIWERIAALTMRWPRLILAVIGAGTLFFAYHLFHLEMDTNVRNFYRQDTLALSQTIARDFHEGSFLSLIFESQNDESTLSPRLLKQQFQILEAIKARYDVKTISIVDGVNAGLYRTDGRSIPDLEDHENRSVAQAIVALSGGSSILDLEKAHGRNIYDQDGEGGEKPETRDNR